MSLTDAFNALLDEALGHLTSIATSLLNVGLASVLTALQGRGIFDDISALLGGVVDTLGGHVNNILGSLTQVGGSLLDAVTPHLQDLQDQLTLSALGAAQSLLGTLAGISGTLTGRDIWNDLLSVVTDLGSSLAQQLLLGALGSLLGKRGIFDDISALFGGVIDTLGGHVNNIVGSLTTVGGSLLDAVTPHLQDLQDQLTLSALGAAQSLLGTLAGISGTLQG